VKEKKKVMEFRYTKWDKIAIKLAGLVITLAILILANGACAESSASPPYAKASGERVCLVNNKHATDPTWQQLLSFLATDNTDDHPYVIGSFVCADFAEMLHNNAENTGIKAAFVVATISKYENGVIQVDQHALNAFNTVDKGLVYIDCTGKGYFSFSTLEGSTINVECDRVAYVATNKEYGLIGIDKAKSPDYYEYEHYEQLLNNYYPAVEAYNAKALDFTRRVETYNSEALDFTRRVEAHNRNPYDQSTYYKLMAEKTALDAEKAKLDAEKIMLDTEKGHLETTATEIGRYSWNPLGDVSKVETYW
jgi:hypothetical protein